MITDHLEYWTPAAQFFVELLAVVDQSSSLMKPRSNWYSVSYNSEVTVSLYGCYLDSFETNAAFLEYTVVFQSIEMLWEDQKILFHKV